MNQAKEIAGMWLLLIAAIALYFVAMGVIGTGVNALGEAVVGANWHPWVGVAVGVIVPSTFIGAVVIVRW